MRSGRDIGMNAEEKSAHAKVLKILGENIKRQKGRISLTLSTQNGRRKIYQNTAQWKKINFSELHVCEKK